MFGPGISWCGSAVNLWGSALRRESCRDLTLVRKCRRELGWGGDGAYRASPSFSGCLMPYRFNEPRRRRIPRARYRVQNWPEYDRALQQRGSLTVWVTPEALAAWQPPRNRAAESRRVLDDIAKTALGPVLVVPREELRPLGKPVRAADEASISRSRHGTPDGDGGGHGPAATQDGAAVQPGGGLRAAAGRAGRVRGLGPRAQAPRPVLR